MRVKLLKDVTENGVVKTTVRKSRKQVIGWFEGTKLEVSDTTGAKLIERGDAEEVPEAERLADDERERIEAALREAVEKEAARIAAERNNPPPASNSPEEGEAQEPTP